MNQLLNPNCLLCFFLVVVASKDDWFGWLEDWPLIIGWQLDCLFNWFLPCSVTCLRVLVILFYVGCVLLAVNKNGFESYKKIENLVRQCVLSRWQNERVKYIINHEVNEMAYCSYCPSG